MLNEKFTADIQQLIEPFLKEAGVVLVDLNIRRTHRNFHIEILADKSNGGITIDECARLNRVLRDAIEAQNLITENYILEVSSPGLDRPLKTAGDFLRMMGREIRFFLSEPVGNKLEHTGIVSKVENENLTVETLGGKIFIPIQSINKAHLNLSKGKLCTDHTVL